MMRKSCKYLTLLFLLSLFACGEKATKQQILVPKNQMKKSMETANRYMLNEEEEDIENYIKRHGLEMVSTGTGLRYQILKQGSEKRIEKGETVVLDYELCSVAGDLIYSSEKDGKKTFVVGDGSVESGLEEAITHLHKGDLAKVIIPSHLGFGLHGDDNLIHGFTTLVYTLKVDCN